MNTTTNHSHTGADGFLNNCAYCGGGLEQYSWDNPKMVCGNCGYVQPCCGEKGVDAEPFLGAFDA